MWRKEKWGESDFRRQKFGQTGKKIQTSDSPEILRFVSILKLMWAVHLVK
jgi:hypothetical protein